MLRDQRLFLRELVDAMRRAIDWLGDLSPSQLRENAEKCAAIERQLLIVGEAAKQVPEEWRRLAPDADWRGMCRLRDFLAHS